jgi:transcriptional regulator with XRE-family HTH domain
MKKEKALLRQILSTNIKHYRAKTGLSQEKLAAKVGVSDHTINNIEGCRTWVTDGTLLKIAKALNIEVYQLFAPTTETDKLFPVTLPETILNGIKSDIKKYVDTRFSQVATHKGK